MVLEDFEMDQVQYINSPMHLNRFYLEISSATVSWAQDNHSSITHLVKLVGI